MTAQQIMEKPTPQGVKAPQQIYRALQGLTGRRLVHRIES